MTHRASPITTWRTIPLLAAVALVPVAMLLQHWDPCDSTAAIASGSSMMHIGVCLVIGVLTGLGISLAPKPTRNPSSPRSGWERNVLVLVCLLSVLWLALATAGVYSKGNLRYAVNGFWQWTSMLVWSISIGILATRPGFIRLATTGMLSVGVGMLVYGYWEYGVIQPALRQQLEQNPAALFRRQGIAAESSAALLLADRIRSTEMKGVFVLANSLGGFLAGLWILVMGIWRLEKKSPNRLLRSPLWNGLAVVLLAAIAIALLLTKSRTAWIAAAFGSVALILVIAKMRARVKRHTLALGAIALGAITTAIITIVYLFDPLILQEAGKSLAYRFDYWRGASELIVRSPWFGYGVGGFQSSYLQVKLPTAAESPADPHNFLLEVAHSGGIPCLLFVALALVLAIRLAFQESSGDEVDTEQDNANKSLSVAFWTGGAIAVGGLLLWSLFTDSDEKLLGLLAAFASSIAIAVLFSRWPTSRASVQALVNQPAVFGILLLVNLVHGLASGGWLLPGTMGMVMMGTGLVFGSTRPTTQSEIGVAKHSLGWIGITSVLLAAWYGTMALPVSKGLEQSGRVLGGLDANPTPQQLRQLMAADRWDPDLARFGMEWVADHLGRPMGKESRTEWETVLKDQQREFVQRDPKNALAWEACGQASVRAAASISDPDQKKGWLEEADRAFQKTSELCPASVQWHIQAALSASWVHDWQRSLEHCTESEKIDQVTPHRDRKVGAAQVFWPIALVPRDALDQDARQGTTRDWVKAEPVLRYLRSQGRGQLGTP